MGLAVKSLLRVNFRVMAELREYENLTNISISAKLGEIREDVLECGKELEKEVHGRVGGLVSDLLNELEGHACRIAFIGQVKAGKSSLINALIQRPNFLPTDVNPSTAVVTKLIIGSQSRGADTALFHFFTDEEWNGLIAQGPVQQKRSQMFSLPASRQKLNELQRRAEKRLGKKYNELIGKHHLFSAVTPNILHQYVSASEQFSDRDGAVYSDITRMAEIFLESKPYLYPSVLIDTPGVNDLFFVRDDITYANLADADVYVLLLTAQQPLSRGDLSLLRLLRGLQKDKVIAIVNRIDCLTNPSDEVEPLEDFVRQTLARECPQAAIPVVSVSALWATMALSLGANGVQFPMTETFMQYAKSSGFGTSLQTTGGGQRTHFNPDDREMLIACSGIPRVTKLISSLIGNAITEEQLLPAATTLRAIAHNAATSSRFGIVALAPSKPTGASHAALAPDIKSKAYSSFKQI